MNDHLLTDLSGSLSHVRASVEGNFSQSGAEASYLSFGDYWNILLKRKWWVIGVFLFVVLAVGITTFLMTPIYQASTILQITQDNPSAIIGERDPLASLSGQDTLSRFYETQYMILDSRPMAYRIIDILHLQDYPEYKAIQKRYPEKSPAEVKSLMAEKYQQNLDIKPLKKSYLVEIAFKSSNKDLATRVCNTIYQEYIKFSMSSRQQSYALIKEWLEGELQQLGAKVQDSESKLYKHGQKKDFLSLEGKENNVIVNKYVDLVQLLTKAQSERALKEAQYRQIKEKGMDATPITNNLLIQKLREETITQEAKLSGLKKLYDINYPQLKVEQEALNDLRLRLNEEIRRTRTSIESDYETALKAEKLLEETMTAQKGKVTDLQNNLVEHHILKRDMQANEQLYQALLARMKEASIASTMVASNVAVITPAEAPLVPYRPRKKLNLLLGGVLGLMGGVTLAFAMEYLDDSIKSTKEMERLCRVPVLGVVPLLSQNGARLIREEVGNLELATFRKPKSMIAEAIYHIRTSVMLSQAGGPPRAIMITSPNPSEGKSTLSLNLASSLAMNGQKVVILDADLRKPSLHGIMDLSLQPGLSNFLTGSCGAEEILRTTFIPNLFFISAGTPPPNPMDLLTSKTFVDLLTDLKKEFQHVIIDTPPIIGFADGRFLSCMVDGVLLILKHHSTSRESARLSLQLLTQVHAHILGGVLNMAKSDKLGYGGYYSYYKYYQHYYKHYHLNENDGHLLENPTKE